MMQNEEKLDYTPPVVVEYGTVIALTQGTL